MHADELRMAVSKIVDILNQSEIRAVVDEYRSSKGDQRTAAAAKLGQAGAAIRERISAGTAVESQVVKCLHLETLGSPDYWQNLLVDEDDPRKQQAEIVRLASRVMFASSHLPGLISLLDAVKNPPASSSIYPLETGEGRLSIRLTDAGERASDPDRIARAIDGIDMLYSACASIARKPAMDLRLDGVGSKRNNDRELHFTGEKDSIAAVFAVIDSIPGALADIDPDKDIDLDAVVLSLPIFKDLGTLASLSNLSAKDLKDISDTLHQGALLSLESGVILMVSVDAPDEKVTTASSVTSPDAVPVSSSAQEHHVLTEVEHPQTADSSPPAERDEHYERYLREREAMMREPAVKEANGGASSTLDGQDADHARSEDQVRRDAVDELLKSLGQTRNS